MTMWTGPRWRGISSRSSTRNIRKKTTEAGWRRRSRRCLSLRSPRACSTAATTRCGRFCPRPFAIKTLLDFWRQTGEDGKVLYDFTNPEWNTRFLGDLYQDLSESARKTYALLQTPEFVEEFILDYTLDPAIEEFGLEPDPPQGHEDLPKGLRVIDPACGSGHFLLGAFRRLLSAWETASLRLTGTSWLLRHCRLSTGWTRTHSRRRSPGSA